uniref:Uncharacterized protein n=1 Tax=Timema tahoe TaxID=61484 RepID=A0A7R9FH69_9NEOP|nr:unnamed protein product [Timema tahoe]
MVREFMEDPFFRSPASPHSGFHQVARMMDSLILDSFSPFTFTKITTTHRPVKTSTSRRSTATQHPQRQHSHRPSPVKPQHPPTHQEVYPATSNTDASRNHKSSNTSPPASDKWVASLRRRDPEIQPALPAINPRRGRWLHGPHRTAKVRTNILSTIRPRRRGAGSCSHLHLKTWIAFHRKNAVRCGAAPCSRFHSPPASVQVSSVTEKEIPQEDGKMTVIILQSRTSEQVGSVSEKERS